MVKKSFKQKSVRDICWEFEKKYLMKGNIFHWNVINLNPADSIYHNRMICEVCLYLLHHGIPFLTQAEFNKGEYRGDIVAPSHIQPIIEIRYSETQKKTDMKKLPEELKGKVIYVDIDKESKFVEKMIL